MFAMSSSRRAVGAGLALSSLLLTATTAAFSAPADAAQRKTTTTTSTTTTTATKTTTTGKSTGTATTMYAGVVGDAAAIAAGTGVTPALHTYAKLEGKVTTDRMVTISSASTWAQIAAAKPGSPVHSNIVRFAQTIKARPGVTLVAFEHEPELSRRTTKGTNADFKAAYRTYVRIFREQGVTNVRYVWQMTEWAFRNTDKTASTNPDNWYPGDDVVDIVGADAYNWFDCGVVGRGRWVELQTLTEPAVRYALAHGKKAALPEFGVHDDPRRAQWLLNARAYLASRTGVIEAAYYFQHKPTNTDNADCAWPLNDQAEYTALGTLLKAPNVQK